MISGLRCLSCDRVVVFVIRWVWLLTVVCCFRLLCVRMGRLVIVVFAMWFRLYCGFVASRICACFC